MASEPVDPLQALSAALAVPSDSKEQADLLAKLRESLEAHPSPIPILCTTLIKTVSGAGDSLLKRWVLDLLHFAICRSGLSLEARTQCACSICDFLGMMGLTDLGIFSGFTIPGGPRWSTQRLKSVHRQGRGAMLLGCVPPAIPCAVSAGILLGLLGRLLTCEVIFPDVRTGPRGIPGIYCLSRRGGYWSSCGHRILRTESNLLR